MLVRMTKTADPIEASAKKIAVFAGPTATVVNTAALITSDKARASYGLDENPTGVPLRRTPDSLRPQRLAAPVTVYVEQFSAHPLEQDAAALYAPPDGFIAGGVFSEARRSESDIPVYRVTLEPDDGLYLLPYFGRQANGRAWDTTCTDEASSSGACRQTFYPDASRLFEEIDRFGLGDDGHAGLLSSRATYDFFRAVPSGGYTQGLKASQRTDVGAGDITPEALGVDYFPYAPIRREPRLAQLAQITNVVTRSMASDDYAGMLWLEGSPNAEETCYWLGLLVDTTVPIVATTAPDSPHGTLRGSGDRNVVDAIDYILSEVWMDATGRDRVGPTVIHDQLAITARDAQKGSARAGGFLATGGHGGVVAAVGDRTTLMFIPHSRSTHASQVNLTSLPNVVSGVERTPTGIRRAAVRTKTPTGDLSADAMPSVTIVKGARFEGAAGSGGGTETAVLSIIEWNLDHSPLSGFVAEGAASYGTMPDATTTALTEAAFSGMPVVKVGRGNADGVVTRRSVGLAIAGGNMTATKARLLLMACLLRFGALPPARNPARPTTTEVAATESAIAEYQRVFDTH